MRITLLRAKERLAPTSPVDKLENRIATICEKLIVNGKWRGSMHPIALRAFYGQAALPRHYTALEGVRVDRRVREIVNQWWAFLPGKTDYGLMAEVENQGDSFATMYPMPLGGRGYTSAPTVEVQGDGAGATVSIEMRNGSVSKIKIENPGSGYTTATIVFTGGGDYGSVEAAAVATVVNGALDSVSLVVGGNLRLTYAGIDDAPMTIYGTDQNFQPVKTILTGTTTPQSANLFTHIDRVHKEQTEFPMTLTHIAVSGDETPLAILSEKTEESYYHRYRVDTLALTRDATITALAKLKFVEFESDQDVLPFTNMAALELAMRAENFIDENDVVLAAQYWTEAIDLLNAELKDAKAVDEYPVIRFIYPGRTAPKYTSHY